MKRSAVRNLASGGVLSLARLISGVVKTKILALFLGASGVGIFGLLLQAQATGVALVSMSLAVPLINLARRYIGKDEFEAPGAIAGTILTILAFNMLILLLLYTLIGGRFLSAIGLAHSGIAVWPIILAIIIAALSASFWEGLAFLSDRFDLYVRAGIIGALSDGIIVACAAYFYGLNGAVYAVPIGASGLLIAYVCLLSREKTASQVIAKLSVQTARIPQILSFSATMLSTIALTGVALTFLRSMVLGIGGAAANGQLQVATALSSYLLAFITTGFWGHLHSKAASEGDSAEVRAELAKSLHLGMLASFTGCGVVAIFAPQIVPLFYAHDFLPAVPMIRLYMIGEFSFQIFSMLIAYQLVISRKRAYIGLSLTYAALMVIGGYLMMPFYGAIGYVYAHILAATFALVSALIIAMRADQITWDRVLKIIVSACILASLSKLISTQPFSSAPSFLTEMICAIPFGISGLMILNHFRLAARDAK